MDRGTWDTTTPGGPRSTDPSVIEALADEQRRHVLDALRDEGTVELTVLTDAVRRREGLPPAASEELRILLYHVHLPKLAAAGLVTFDPAAGTARFDPPPELADRLTGPFARHDG